MKRSATRVMIVATALMFFLGFFETPLILAANQKQKNEVIEIEVKVTQKGFLDNRGKAYGPKNPLKVPEGKVARITFVFSENMASLAYGDTHQVAITSKNAKWIKETEKIWMFNQKTAITFLVGEAGEQYRGYCIVDCIGMDHLNNLVIQVV